MNTINNRTAVRFVCRSCLGSITKSTSTQRPFSSTTSKGNLKSVPSFTPSSSPELDALLNDYREKVFIPQALSKTHQRLVYRGSRQSVLINDPGVTVTIGEDEEFRLVPLKYSERPEGYKSFKAVQQLLADNQDDSVWSNTFPFFQGLYQSKSLPTPSQFQRFIRSAVKQGQSKYIIKLFEHPTKTGFTFSKPDLVHAFMQASHSNAEAAHFKGIEMDQVARDVQHVAKLMERDDHSGHASQPNQFDSRRGLITISLLLESAAAACINTHRSKDTDGQVADYLAKALALTGTGLADGTSPHIWRDPGIDEERYLLHTERPTYLILLTAFEMASRIDGLPPDHQRQALASRMSAIKERLKYQEQFGTSLFASREEKRKRKTSSPVPQEQLEV